VLHTLKQIALGALGLAAWLAGRVGLRRSSPPHASEVLAELARHTSRTVPEISSALNLSADATAAVLAELEERGLIRVSGDKGSSHVRIAAITARGREEASRQDPGEKAAAPNPRA
jgi:DNA-binding IclR family transcriptional regulator